MKRVLLGLTIVAAAARVVTMWRRENARDRWLAANGGSAPADGGAADAAAPKPVHARHGSHADDTAPAVVGGVLEVQAPHRRGASDAAGDGRIAPLPRDPSGT